MSLYINKLETPIGNIVTGASDKGICLIEFEDKSDLTRNISKIQKLTGYKSVIGTNSHSLMLKEELKAYFEKKLTCFATPLDIIGTDFQKMAWHELLKIPYGKTNSYMQQAFNIKNSKAVRAVANANSKNLISIIIPCHRVIGSNGNLTGYAGGMERKKYLLNLESSNFGLFDYE